MKRARPPQLSNATKWRKPAQYFFVAENGSVTSSAEALIWNRLLRSKLDTRKSPREHMSYWHSRFRFLWWGVWLKSVRLICPRAQGSFSLNRSQWCLWVFKWKWRVACNDLMQYISEDRFIYFLGKVKLFYVLSHPNSFVDLLDLGVFTKVSAEK